MDSQIAPRASAVLKDKVFHANIQIQSIEDVSNRDEPSREESRLVHSSESALEAAAHPGRAALMQSWWDEAIVKNMDLPDGYSRAAVLIVKWDAELDELNTGQEARELEALFKNRFRFETMTVQLNVASKPQHQINKHLSEFIEKYDGPNHLLIVYYTGHGVYQEKLKHLELTASLSPMAKRGLGGSARFNWNKVEDQLKADDVESDVLTILDTCYSSNIAKSSREETRTFELLSACAIDATTAAPGDNSFTRALINALNELLNEYGDRPFTTFHLNQRILLDPRRHDTPSQLWFRMQNHERHIRLGPIKQVSQVQSPSLTQPARGHLTLRFALRDEFLNQQQIEYLTMNLSKAFHKKALVGLRRIDWLGIRPAHPTPLGRTALAVFAIAQWKRFLTRRREEKRSRRIIDDAKLPLDASITASPGTLLNRKRSWDEVEELPEPKRERHHLVIPQPPSPPVSEP